jgi:HAE1 family hydrophobic/amphiphilic exporter-1
VTIGQAGVGTQVTDSFAKLVAIDLVYLIMVILVRSLLVPVVILYMLPLAVIGAFVAVAVTVHERDLSALISLLMLTDIVVIDATVLLNLAVATNAIVLLDLVQHKIEASADVRTALI